MTNLLLYDWDVTLDYTLRRVADVSEEPMVYQPAAGMNHLAWILCHPGLVRSGPFRDPRQSPDASRYDEGSMPLPDLLQYPRKATLVENFAQGHKELSAALRQRRSGALETPASLDRWRQAFGTVGTPVGRTLTHRASKCETSLLPWLG